MKKIKTIFSILFFAILVSTTLLTIFIPDKEYSEVENRLLTQKPVLTVDNIIEGKFQFQLGEYLSDQFPLREKMIKLNTSLNKVLGAKNINGAYIGENGFYFEVETDKDIDFENHEKNLNAIKIFEQKYPDINVKTILVPTSSVVYNEYLPKGAKIYNSEKLFESANNILGNKNFIDVRETFHNNKEENLFYKTDHHFTTFGAYYAYIEYCKALNITPRSKADFDFNVFSNDFYGSLHSKNLDPDAKPDTIYLAKNTGNCNVLINGVNKQLYDTGKISNKDKYLVFFGDNYSEVVINTECKNGKTLLVVKDSFANSFVPLLTKDFENIIMIDQRYNNLKGFSALIDKYSVTDTLFMYDITNLSLQEHLTTACKN